MSFRSLIWLPRIVLAALLAACLLGPPAAWTQETGDDESEFVSLFNGRDLTEWMGDQQRWSVEDGAITGRNTEEDPLEHNTFLIWEGGKPSDFELRFTYRIVGGNSGVQYRSQVVDPERFIVAGYQADIDSSPRFTGMNYEERGRAFLAQRGQKIEMAPDGTKNLVGTFGDPAALQRMVKDEQWNEYRVLAQGKVLKHFVNGRQMSEVIDNQQDKAASSGVIALQLHQGPPMKVQFRDIRLRRIR